MSVPLGMFPSELAAYRLPTQNTEGPEIGSEKQTGTPLLWRAHQTRVSPQPDATNDECNPVPERQLLRARGPAPAAGPTLI
jgi:hypothetical protein